MANAYSILGQNNPGNTLTDLYVVPASTEAVGTLYIANREAAANTVRVSVAEDGAADSNEQYLLYDVSIPANDTLILPGISLSAADDLRTYASDTNVSFTFMGVEIST
jgi:hypothetical protein